MAINAWNHYHRTNNELTTFTYENGMMFIYTFVYSLCPVFGGAEPPPPLPKLKFGGAGAPPLPPPLSEARAPHVNIKESRYASAVYAAAGCCFYRSHCHVVFGDGEVSQVNFYMIFMQLKCRL